MKGFFFILLLSIIAQVAAYSQSTHDEHKTLTIGYKAPDFKLPGERAGEE